MVSTVSPTLANPVSVLSSQIEDKGVRAAFDKAAKDWTISRQEARDLFTKAETDSPGAMGPSVTAVELRDLHRIREQGAFLLRPAAVQAMDRKLAVLDNLPSISLSENDAKLKTSQVAVNRISFQGQAFGFIKPHSKSSSEVSMTIGEKTFQVLLNPGESAFSVAQRMQEQLKASGYESSIVTAKHIGGPSVLEVKPLGKPGAPAVGKYSEFTGTIHNKHLVGPGGEAPPSGSYLTLDKPIKVDGKTVTEVFAGYEEFHEGSKVRLNARLDVGTYGGVETAEKSYLLLTGISDLKAGEPAFDGQVFKNAQGSVLDRGSYMKPLIMDAPAVLFVFDPENGKAFRGAMGGFLAPKMNPFHGFNSSGKIETASAADKKALKFDSDGTPKNKAGEALVQITEHNDGPVIADGMSSNWWLDVSASKLYQVQNGGFAGFHNVVSNVIKF
ncbi:MAG: hypothetical protein U1E65_21450 [Myxococcota bacterium]